MNNCMERGFKHYFKWTFTRWYFWSFVSFWSVWSGLEHIINKSFSQFLGTITAVIILMSLSFIIIYIIKFYAD